MSAYSVAIIGTGPHPDTDSHDGYSMGYRHTRSYRAADGCEVYACADIIADNAADFVEEFGLPTDRAYTDHRRMLKEIHPDVVSICTPPSTHPDLVADCARHDGVRAIHCEKPMAATFGESRQMIDICEDHGVQLTVNFQNRCSDVAAEIKDLVADGAIGGLERIELARHDLLQTGLHHIDLANYVMDDEPIEWVLGQIDYSEEKVWYTDMHTETQSLGTWRYESGVDGLCATGDGMDMIGPSTNRMIGTEGRIEMDLSYYDFRIRTADSSEWAPIETEDPSPQDNVIQHIVDTIDRDADPLVSDEVALAATEVVFGIWESARRRGRVEFPLEIENNPLESMIASGDLPPKP